MSYPDVLIVDRSSSRALVCVEAKLRVPNLVDTETQLKAYMQGTRCPIGMLATPETLRVFVDDYGTTAVDSVAVVGQFDMRDVPGWPIPAAPPDVRDAAFAFEAAVQRWVERLGSKAYRASLPDALRDLIEEHVVPALFVGEVRAAGPRWRHHSETAAT